RSRNVVSVYHVPSNTQIGSPPHDAGAGIYCFKTAVPVVNAVATVDLTATGGGFSPVGTSDLSTFVARAAAPAATDVCPPTHQDAVVVITGEAQNETNFTQQDKGFYISFN